MTKNIELKKSSDSNLPAFVEMRLRELVAKECRQCGNCVAECSFLQKHGTPGQIAELAYTSSAVAEWAFSCSLCQLCTHNCPKQLPIADMFFELRKSAITKKPTLLTKYRPLRFHEGIGGSSLLSEYLLPAGCDIVYFPGCSLPGIRPKQTEQLFLALQKKYPRLGLVLDCCAKPSHSLGDLNTFNDKHSIQLKRLSENGIQHVITSCPSCLQVFRQNRMGLRASMAYTHLEKILEHTENQTKDTIKGNTYTVHDPCTARFEEGVHTSIRSLVKMSGGSVVEMAHSGSNALCCGEGGATGFTKSHHNDEWQKKRKAEAGTLPLITYCAGCTISLKSFSPIHILDLLFPDTVSKNKKLAKAPWSYLNRFLFKRKMASYFSN